MAVYRFVYLFIVVGLLLSSSGLVYAAWIGTPDQLSWGGDGGDYSRGIVVDGGGGIYIGGYTFSYGFSLMDIFITKFDSGGNVLWSYIWYFDVDADNRLLDLEISGDTIYGAGYTELNFTYSGVLLGVDANGSLICEQIFMKENDSLQIYGLHVLGVDVGLGGRVGSYAFGGWIGYVSNCIPMWQTTLSSRTVYISIADVYLTKELIYFVGTAGLGTNDLLIGYLDYNGNLISYSVYDIGGDVEPHDILIDNQGDIVVSGTLNPQNQSTIFLSKFDSSLNPIFNYRIVVVGFDSGRGYDIAVDNLNNIYLAGEVSTANDSNSVLVELSGGPTFFMQTLMYNHVDYDGARDVVVPQVSGDIITKYITGYLSNSIPYPWVYVNTSISEYGPDPLTNISIAYAVSNLTAVSGGTYQPVSGAINTPSLAEAYLIRFTQVQIDEFKGLYQLILIATAIIPIIYILKRR